MKENLKGLTLAELEAKMVSIGHSAFRGRQLFRWINLRRESDFHKMTDLHKSFRDELDQKFELPKVKLKKAEISREDGTAKYLVELGDGETVEAVFIPSQERNTLCVSTQVGCKMACTFCATGYMKFTRDLKAWEIVDQLYSIDFPAPISNIVLMGMGEPFDNYDEVIKSLEIFTHPMGAQIGKRHITVSTVGLTPKIQAFLDANVAKLAISLHGTTEEQRSKIMPISRKHSLDELMETCRTVRIPGRNRITFEYILIRDFNDSDEDAHRLAKLLRGIPSKINLLAYNENPFINFKRPDEKRVLSFQNILLNQGYTATYRRSRGRDIAGACGQLRTQEDKALQTSRLRAERAAATAPREATL
jgi:23S rRNA (adenine2503-C2)-methyltransferase